MNKLLSICMNFDEITAIDYLDINIKYKGFV